MPIRQTHKLRLRKLITLALVAMGLHATAVHAEDTDTPMFSFSGFGTLGVVHSSENNADFTSVFLKPNGAGYSRSWSADVDSLIGGQVTASLTPQLSAVLQIIAEQNYDNSYRPHVEWANIQYQFTPDFNVRVGRFVLPTFLFSGTRKVAYTYPWVRPPLEVYQRVAVTAGDGVDVSYRVHVDDFTHIVQAAFGGSKQALPGGGTAKAEQARGVNYSVEYHDTTVHLAYQRSTLTIDSVKPLFDAFRQFGAEGSALADKYDANKKPFPTIAAGVTYDPGTWFVTTEWAHTENRSFLGKGSGWYASGGYRIGKFTPYLTYARATTDNLSDPGLTVSALPPPQVGPATGLNAALNELLSKKIVQNTLSIGGRWELTRNSAFKLQLDHTDIGAGSSGVLRNTQPGFQLGGTVNVFSATLDFVF